MFYIVIEMNLQHCLVLFFYYPSAIIKITNNPRQESDEQPSSSTRDSDCICPGWFSE